MADEVKQSDSDAHDAYYRLSSYFAAIESGVAGLDRVLRRNGGVCWRSEDLKIPVHISTLRYDLLYSLFSWVYQTSILQKFSTLEATHTVYAQVLY